MIAEVHRVAGVTLADAKANTALADEARKVPGSEHLLMLGNEAGDGIVIHLWRDKAAHDAFANRRDEMIRETEQQGGRIDVAEYYEVIYNSWVNS